MCTYIYIARLYLKLATTYLVAKTTLSSMVSVFLLCTYNITVWGWVTFTIGIADNRLLQLWTNSQHQKTASRLHFSTNVMCSEQVSLTPDLGAHFSRPTRKKIAIDRHFRVRVAFIKSHALKNVFITRHRQNFN